MLDYKFGQSLDRYDWSTGTFRDSTSPIGIYVDGIPSFSLGLIPEEKKQEPEQGTQLPPNQPPPPTSTKKKGKAWIWLIIVPLLLAAAFFAYKKLTR